MVSAFFTGFFLGLSLIVAIGSQNAFVLRQGILRQHVFFIAIFCSISDSFLIIIGVTGISYFLNDFINEEKKRGSNLINNHLLVRHKRWSIPISAFILTLIAVAVSSFKRRGGMGVNLAFGITLGFLFIFFDKIFGVMVSKSTFSPFLAAWLPLFIFSLLAFFLLRHAKR